MDRNWDGEKIACDATGGNTHGKRLAPAWSIMRMHTKTTGWTADGRWLWLAVYGIRARVAALAQGSGLRFSDPTAL